MEGLEAGQAACNCLLSYRRSWLWKAAHLRAAAALVDQVRQHSATLVEQAELVPSQTISSA